MAVPPPASTRKPRAPPASSSAKNAEVVDRRGHVILRAPLEGDLELARQRRAQTVAQQEPRQRFGVRRHVESLPGRGARVRAGGDVAHRVAAGLARRDARVGEPAHRVFHVVQLHEVELDVLPGRDVAEPARVPLADVGEHPELVAREHALRDLHAQHLRVAGLALAVRPPHQPEGPPLVGRQLAALVPLERRDELVDVGHAGEGQPRAAVRGALFW